MRGLGEPKYLFASGLQKILTSTPNYVPYFDLVLKKYYFHLYKQFIILFRILDNCEIKKYFKIQVPT